MRVQAKRKEHLFPHHPVEPGEEIHQDIGRRLADVDGGIDVGRGGVDAEYLFPAVFMECVPLFRLPLRIDGLLELLAPCAVCKLAHGCCMPQIVYKRFCFDSYINQHPR